MSTRILLLILQLMEKAIVSRLLQPIYGYFAAFLVSYVLYISVFFHRLCCAWCVLCIRCYTLGRVQLHIRDMYCLHLLHVCETRYCASIIRGTTMNIKLSLAVTSARGTRRTTLQQCLWLKSHAHGHDVNTGIYFESTFDVCMALPHTTFSFIPTTYWSTLLAHSHFLVSPSKSCNL